MPRVSIFLPDFIIIGANKAGTTSVANYLGQHPEIKMCEVKEPMYFTADPLLASEPRSTADLSKPFFASDLSTYSKLFSGWKEDATVFGEASTAYLCNPRIAAPEIRKIVPSVKLVVILRHPVDRAISAYKMVRGSGLESREFSEIVADSINGGANLLRRQGVKEYVRNGLYGKQIEIFLSYFPKENFLFMNYDNLKKNTYKELKNICKFIGISTFEFNTKSRYNTASEYGANNVSISNKDKHRLHEFFLEDITRTSNLTGLELNSWLGRYNSD